MSTIRSTEALFPYIQIGGLHVDFLVILIYVTQAHDLIYMQIWLFYIYLEAWKWFDWPNVRNLWNVYGEFSWPKGNTLILKGLGNVISF